MAISDRINEMYTHVGDVYDTITNVDLPTNKNIQNIPSTMRSSYLEIMNNGIDKIWNNWEKVTGEGETLTLNSTEEAPMKTNLKGNTSQETTTGKNLIGLLFVTPPTKVAGANFDYSLNSFTLQGTTTSTWAIINLNYNYKIQTGKTYTMSANVTGTNPKMQISAIGYDTGRNELFRFRINQSNNYSQTLTTNFSNPIEVCTFVIEGLENGGTYNLSATDIQIEESATKTSFEPYTGGQASPNPQYPQDIHVVSGDNSIKVEGKNLFDKDNAILINGYAGTTTIGKDNNMRSIYVACKPNTTYTISKMLSARFKVSLTNTNVAPAIGTTITSSEQHNNYTSITITTGNDTTYIVVWYYYATADTSTEQEIRNSIQIEVGSTATTTYEAYKGASYPISLGVENLFDKDNANVLDGMFINASAGNIGSNANATSIYIPINPNTTYCVSKTKGNRFAIGYSSTTPAVNVSLTNIVDDRTKTSLTSTSASDSKYLVIYISLSDTETYENIISTLQVEYGSKTNSYTPFGTTPIELCKIGDYQDSIKKSTGKNLIGLGTQLNGYVDQSTLKFQTNPSSIGYYFETSKLPNTITISAVNSNRANVCYFSEIPAYQSVCALRSASNDNPRTITVDKTYPYMHIQFSYNEPNVVNIMLNEGSTALPYEPYGKVWYVNKQIGKYTITGQESATQYYWSSEINGIKFVLDDAIKTVANVPTYCNRFNQWYSGTTANNYVRLNRTTSYLGFWFGNITIEGVNSISTFKSYATNNQVLLYYPLETPTYTEITDSTLISQLEALNGAKSYTTQTNISQVNNDKPFILDATALKQLT